MSILVTGACGYAAALCASSHTQILCYLPTYRYIYIAKGLCTMSLLSSSTSTPPSTNQHGGALCLALHLCISSLRYKECDQTLIVKEEHKPVCVGKMSDGGGSGAGGRTGSGGGGGGGGGGGRRTLELLY